MYQRLNKVKGPLKNGLINFNWPLNNVFNDVFSLMDRQARKLQTQREEVGAFGDEAAHEPSDDEEKEVNLNLSIFDFEFIDNYFKFLFSSSFWDRIYR